MNIAWILAFGVLAAPLAAPPPPTESPEERALRIATERARSLGGGLKARVMDALTAGGPAGAVAACAQLAPTETAAAATAGPVGRSSLRLRNPANVGPDWVQAWLREAGHGPAAAARPVREITQSPAGPVARVGLPISIEGPCLLCHGDPATRDPATAAAIRAAYPSDAANGYQLGDLRGLLWAEEPVRR